VRGPALDGEQTGYGPGYRLYRGGDGEWFALVVPSPDAWRRLAAMLPDGSALPEAFTPLRGGGAPPDDEVGEAAGGDAAAAVKAEAVLEAVFAGEPAAAWVDRLRAAGLLAEPVRRPDRDGFRRGVLDDPVNRQLGRVTSYDTADWGRFEQIGPLIRCGPGAGTGPRLMLPGIGEHTVEVLRELGFSDAETSALLAEKVARKL
jgi:crotonobetainyl-CoA:carnitine CoA-transferase CaiB-like acyl-CoA transferase